MFIYCVVESQKEMELEDKMPTADEEPETGVARNVCYRDVTASVNVVGCG